MRGIYAFLRFCFEQEYAEAYPLSLLKEDETVKDPYTDAELQKLLKQPKSDQWTEWRTWAAINMLVATGIRATTLISIKVGDVDFDQSIIRLRRLKNRKQQFIPLSSALKNVLLLYLKVWDWEPDNYLFPTYRNEQLTPHSMGQSIREYNVARGVMKTSTHLFRHTFAKNYILAGGGMVQLQAILGQSTMDMTRRYVNLYGNEIQRDFDRLNPLNNILAKVWGRHAQHPYQTGGNCIIMNPRCFARWDSKGMKSLWRRFGRAERPTYPLSNFLLCMLSIRNHTIT